MRPGALHERAGAQMKLALLHSSLAARGGADRWLLGVAAGMRRRRPDVQLTLVVGREDPAFPSHERARLGRVVVVKGLDRRGLRGKGRAGAVARLRSALDGVGADVVHCNDVVDPDLLEVVAATGSGVATVQDHRYFCPGPGKRMPDGALCRTLPGPECATCLPDPGYREAVLELTRRRLAALQGMAAITVLSAYMRAELVAAGLPAQRIRCTPGYVDHLPPVDADRTPRHHLFAGRLAAHKGVDVALAAAGLSRTGLPLVVAGDGPLAQQVRTAAGPRVRAVGWVDRPALAGLLSEAASLWLPSTWAEPFGIVGLEALSRGVPVIGTARGGIPEWLHDGHCGTLVPAGDAHALARAADALVSDPGLRKAQGAAGRRSVAARFTLDHCLAALESVYERVGRLRAAEVRPQPE